jgi:hypothetical protein
LSSAIASSGASVERVEWVARAMACSSFLSGWLQARNESPLAEVPVRLPQR